MSTTKRVVVWVQDEFHWLASDCELGIEGRGVHIHVDWFILPFFDPLVELSETKADTFAGFGTVDTGSKMAPRQNKALERLRKLKRKLKGERKVLLNAGLDASSEAMS